MIGNISAAILAGGSGKRFHSVVKPKIVIDGTMIISRILSVLSDIFNEVIIVTNTPAEYEQFKCITVPDEIRGSGPLGGIHAALKKSSNKAVFVFAGDMPFPDRNIILHLAKEFENEACQALVPRIDGYIEPLHSIYSHSLAGAIEEHLTRKGHMAVIEFLKTIDVRYFDFEKSEEVLKAFTNINSPEDIVMAEKRVIQNPY
jgi:molybdopterin-guanine dinucleotide biosynthesis protein A